jgi:ADP-ribose pyrophosphatase
MRRELVEELGYEADQLVPISSFYVSPGGSSERVHLYYAEVSAADRVGDGGGVPAEGEMIEIVVVSVDELLSMVRDGTIADAKTIIGALWLERRVTRR